MCQVFKLVCRMLMYAKLDFHSCMWARWRNVKVKDGKGVWKGEKGWEGWRRRQGCWLVKRFAFSTCCAFCPCEPNPSGVLTLLIREYKSQNALCLCVPESCWMSGVHLFCIKVSGKDAVVVSHLACSSLKGYHQMRAQGGRDMADDCVFYWGGSCVCTAGWHNTPGSQSKPALNKQRQSAWCLWMPP